MIKALLFDLDGVLTDTERLGAELIRQAFAGQNLALDDTLWQSLIGTSSEETSSALRAAYPGIDMDRLMRDWTEITFRYVDMHGVPQKENAGNILCQLHAEGYLLGLCTNNSRPVVAHYLERLRWTQLFDCVAAAEDIEHKKPSPDVYVWVARQLGVAPESCVGIEDSPSGLQAVHRAGMYTVLIPDMIPVKDEIYRDVTLSSLSELPALLKVLQKG